MHGEDADADVGVGASVGASVGVGADMGLFKKKTGFSWLLDVIVCAVPRLILAVNNKRAYF